LGLLCLGDAITHGLQPRLDSLLEFAALTLQD
jgi:hypothetical protein